ncbi:MAG: methyl-accepting chemotaxis protein [Bacteroidetes bacterium]|nr:methyl-accepting chemotaxis protein [Bacteroidota bacterium]
MNLRSFLRWGNKFGAFNVSSIYYFSAFFTLMAILVILVFFLAGVGFVSILFTLLAAFFSSWAMTVFYKRITGLVQEIFEEFRQNDQARIQITGTNEMGQVIKVVNELLERNADLKNQLVMANGKINKLVDALSEQLRDNAEVSATQSSSIAETTATIKELATSAEKIVQETSTVVGLAEATQASAQKGTLAIANMLERMSEIQNENQRRIHEIVILGRKAQEIEKVMDIINDIASNTKIIAFNAGIEAASSGEEGKRFGTVASEIRKLANTVANSTNEIRDKIKEIQKTTNELVIVSEEETKKIQSGVDTAQTMVKELTEILDKADKTLDWVKQISLATQQQLTASEQVAIVLHDISDGVKRFTQAINQSKETSEELKDLSRSLRGMVK